MRAPGSANRRFTIVDAMLLIGATGLALAWLRLQSRAELFGPPFWGLSHGYDTAGRLLQSLWDLALWAVPPMAAWSVATFLLHLRRPRPIVRRLMRQPGFVASLIVTVTLLVNVLWQMAPYAVLHWEDASGELGAFSGALELALFGEVARACAVTGIAVGLAWLQLALSGRWRRDPNWLDRAGLAVGIFWIALGPIAWFANLRD